MEIEQQTLNIKPIDKVTKLVSKQDSTKEVISPCSKRSRCISLDKNENRFSEMISEITLDCFNLKDLYKYPTQEKLLLLAKNISRFHNINSDNLTLGAGSSELLEIIIRLYCKKGDSLIIPKYSFPFYKYVAEKSDITIQEIEPIEWTLSVENIIEAVTKKTKLIILANPSNPIGNYIEPHKIKKILDNIPLSVKLVVDEAYIEYYSLDTKTSMISMVDNYENLIVTRTFSKIYSLANIRLGYCVGQIDTIRNIQSHIRPYSISGISLDIAARVLNKQASLKRIFEKNKKERHRIETELSCLNLSFLQSKTNFITFFMGRKSKSLIQFLIENHIVIKSLEDYDLPGYLRVSIGTTEENIFFLKILKLFLDKNTGVNDDTII